MGDQRGLFDDDPAPPPATAGAAPGPAPKATRTDADAGAWAARLAAQHAEARTIAERLPADVRFGTSSWSFPGWAGLVYSSRRTQAALAREGLREYATHPLLTTVGIDRSYYAPIPVDDFRRYAEQLPDGFRCGIKAPASVTAFALGDPRTPQPNPDFLSPARLIDELLEPCAIGFEAHTGPIIIECPPAPRGLPLDARFFVERLDACLAQLPRDFTYALELRDRRLLTREHLDVLRRHGATHTYNYWTGMALPGAQALAVAPESLTCDTLVIRLLLRPGTRYADQKEAFSPFDRLVEPDEAMREDTVALTRRSLAAHKKVYVLVNNKAEGSSPLTVMALARALANVR